MLCRRSVVAGAWYGSPVASVCRNSRITSSANGSSQTVRRTSAKSRPMSGSMPANTFRAPALTSHRRNAESTMYTPNGEFRTRPENVSAFRRNCSSARLWAVTSWVVPTSRTARPFSNVTCPVAATHRSTPSRRLVTRYSASYRPPPAGSSARSTAACVGPRSSGCRPAMNRS